MDSPGHLGWFKKKERIWIFHTAVNKPGRILGIFLKINPSPWDDSQRNAYNALFSVVFQAHRTRTFETETVWNRWVNKTRQGFQETRLMLPKSIGNAGHFGPEHLSVQRVECGLFSTFRSLKNMFSWWWVSTQPGYTFNQSRKSYRKNYR